MVQSKTTLSMKVDAKNNFFKKDYQNCALESGNVTVCNVHLNEKRETRCWVGKLPVLHERELSILGRPPGRPPGPDPKSHRVGTQPLGTPMCT